MILTRYFKKLSYFSMLIKSKLRIDFGILLRRHGKYKFLKSVVPNGQLLDVGCGNNSPQMSKQQRPDIQYTGIDIGVYNQAHGFEKYVDRLILTSSESFPEEIEKFKEAVDAVISSHNLEHCNDPYRVLLAMINSLRDYGSIYLAFPCENSTKFPSRSGTLNFYDDPTHQNLLFYDEVIAMLTQNHIVIEYSTKQYKPYLLAIVGFIFEPLSRFLNKQVPMGATWAYYGFESIIIGRKLHRSGKTGQVHK